MKTSSAKAKGRRLSAKIREWMLECAVELAPDDIVVTPSGVTGEDLQLSPRAREYFPYSIECKNTERLDLWGALKQCVGHGQRRPSLYFTRNRSEVYVVIPAEDWIAHQVSSALLTALLKNVTPSISSTPKINDAE